MRLRTLCFLPSLQFPLQGTSATAAHASINPLETVTTLLALKGKAADKSFCSVAEWSDIGYADVTCKFYRSVPFENVVCFRDEKVGDCTTATVDYDLHVKNQLCNILRCRSWNEETQELLLPYTKSLSTGLVAKVLNVIEKIDVAKNFFYWAGKQSGYQHDIFVYNAFLTKLGLAKDFMNIWEQLHKMQSEGCMPTSTTFSIIVQSYGNAGILEECWRTVDKSKIFGLKPDVYIYTTLLGVLFNARKVDKARQLLHRLLRFNGILNIRTWSIAIHGFCKNCKMPDAQLCLDRMLEQGCTPNVYIYNAMMLGFSKANCPEKAISLFHKMQKMGYKPDVYTYNTVIQLYCELDKFADADRLFTGMADAGCEPNQVTYNVYLSGLLKMGKKVEADEFFRKMQRERWIDQISYKVYTLYLRRYRDIDKLTCLSKEMFSRYGNVNVDICNAILQHFSESHDLNRAVQYFREELVKLTAPDEFSYSLLVNVLCKLGDFDAAKTVVREMFRRGYKPTDINYNPLIISLSMHSREDEALCLFEEMKEKGIQPSAISCDHLLKALCKSEKVDEALNICRHIAERGHAVKDFTIFLLLRSLNQQNRLEDANNLITKMQHSGCLSKQRRFKVVVQAMLSGNLQEAERYFQDRYGLEAPNVISYSLRIEGFCKRNQVDDAKMILSEMGKLGCPPNVSCYGPIITALCRLGRHKESFALFEEMAVNGIYSSVISNNLMKRLCEAKMANEIVKLGEFIIAKKLTLQNSSVSFLIENCKSSEKLSQLLHDLKESGCLVPRLLVSSSMTIQGNPAVVLNHEEENSYTSS